MPSSRITAEVVALINKLAPSNRPLIGKVVDSGSEDQLPVLSLFVRLPPDGILACINDNVTMLLDA